MSVPYTQCGKRGDTVWQRNRYGQISYPYHKPANPRTAAQRFVRAHFGLISARWRTLSEEQRLAWSRAAKSRKTRRRLGQRWPMMGYNYFIQVNVLLVNRGLEPVDWPPLESIEAKVALPLLTNRLAGQPGVLRQMTRTVAEHAGPAPPRGG